MEQLVRLLSNIFILIIVFFFLQCNFNKKNQSDILYFNIDSLDVKTREGITYVSGQPFSGVLFSLYPNTYDTMEIKTYLKGKEDGEWKQFYKNKQTKEIRYFESGKKQGQYITWWDNGIKKSEYFFKNGEYEGICREWSYQGNLTKEMNYHSGHEEGSQKVWYDNGKIKSNYIVIDGRRYGLLGTKNCINVSDSIFKK